MSTGEGEVKEIQERERGGTREKEYVPGTGLCEALSSNSQAGSSPLRHVGNFAPRCSLICLIRKTGTKQCANLFEFNSCPRFAANPNDI